MERFKIKLRRLCRILFVPFFAFFLLSWGTFGHEHINHAATLLLPPPLQTFFYNHIDFITQESTVPDLRKYTLNDKSENPRHFIDLENFGSIDSLPLKMTDVKSKYDDMFLQQNGILPWYILDMMDKLTSAFKNKRKTEILFLAADLGHYIGDAHMPLHTSVNHDGQLTNQKGVHSFWESELPELFGDNYNFNVPEAIYISNIQAETWNIISSSHALVDTLLSIEKEVHSQFPADKIYMKDKDGVLLKNKFNQHRHSMEYAKEFNTKLNGMVEKQMRAAISATANFWYTAWVNAGKPDLTELDDADLTKRNAELLNNELQLYKQGKISGVRNDKEF
ncbi:MAG: zinc dependent phospholipase C family protein [Bacteroidota bacterium]